MQAQEEAAEAKLSKAAQPKEESTPQADATVPAKPKPARASGLIEVQGGILPANAVGTGQKVFDFQIGISEVTWADWKAVRDASIALGYDLAGVGQGKGDEYPVTGVSWLDAVKWCNAKSQMGGLAPAYTVRGTPLKSGSTLPDLVEGANGYRLPTVPEWEWAARGGTKSTHYKFSGSNNPDAVAWTKENSGGFPQPVRNKAPNELGIFDMSGNVRELCWDQLKGNFKPLLGGCFVQTSQDGELSAKPLSEPIRRVINVGFRLARNAAPSGVGESTAKEKNPSEAIASPGETPDAETALLETQAAKGDVSAQFELGNRYRDGKGVSKDNGKAEEWYRKAASWKGSTEADVELGILYCGGFVKARPVDWARVAAVWEIQAQKGDRASQFRLGNMCYRNGAGVRQDGAKAVYWLEKAAAQNEGPPVYGVGAAMWGLARMYSGDRDLPRDDNKAFYWAEKSAQYGTDTRGMVKLAELYATGRGTPKDPVKAEEWARKAAAKGNTDGLKFIGEN